MKVKAPKGYHFMKKGKGYVLMKHGAKFKRHRGASLTMPMKVVKTHGGK
jgi:hypothetical protein|tara:strand:- start:523 stop:669 length:147 start_codon:yes stop_codon:yes gene_type:complete